MTTLSFLTGTPRSGTSILNALLGEQPGRKALNQPVPLLLVELKKAFLKAQGKTGAELLCPLADQQFQRHDPPAEFSEYLRSARPENVLWENALTAMTSYTGQLTRPAQPRSGSSALFNKTPLKALIAYLGAAHGNPESRTHLVWKEAFGEEFLPALLDIDMECVVIIRDPRDCITSQIAIGGEIYNGIPRPLLYLCRQWRKSALYALGLKHRRGFAAIRFEDLVTDPSSVLAHQVPPGLAVTEDPTTFSGLLPKNSSFDQSETLSRKPIGRYRQMMDPEVRRFIEAVCFEEMRIFGYEPEVSRADRIAIIEQGIKETDTTRPELAAYRWTDRHRIEELERIDSLDAGRDFRPEAFIFEAAFETLKVASANT
jgi:hypothetical protein